MKVKIVSQSLNEFERGKGIHKSLGIGREEFFFNHFGIGESGEGEDPMLPDGVDDIRDVIKLLEIIEYKGYQIFSVENISKKSWFACFLDPDLNPKNTIPEDRFSVSPYMTTGYSQEEVIQEMKDGLDGELKKHPLKQD